MAMTTRPGSLRQVLRSGPRRIAGSGPARVAGMAVVLGAAMAACSPAAAGPAVASTASTASAQATATASTQASASDQFWSGTDSDYIAIPGSGPYREPVIGGAYGGYVGMTGNWSSWRGCRGRVVGSAADGRDAYADYATYHKGIGVAAYWFMAGPGVDPHFNGTSKEAAAWGAAQAAATLHDLARQSVKVTYPVIFMDVEIPGNAPAYTPAPDNGWNTVYTSACSGKVRAHGIAAQVDRADFNGFAGYLTTHSSYKAGVYSAPGVWASIFGTGKWASLTNTYEWTYTSATSSLSHAPSGWCVGGTKTCAQFFGGMTSASKYAVMWQWSGGGGVRNGYGDFDQIDGSRTP